MSFILKSKQQDYFNKISSLLNESESNLNLSIKSSNVKKLFSIMSKDDINSLMKSFDINTIIAFMTIQVENIPPETIFQIVDSVYITGSKNKSTIDLIDCLISEIEGVDKYKSLKNILISKKEEFKNHKPVINENEKISLLDSFKNNVGQGSYNISEILYESASVYEKNVNLDFFIKKFKDFFLNEKRSIISKDECEKLSYSNNFSKEKCLIFVEMVSEANEKEISEIFKHMFSFMFKKGDIDNISYVLSIISAMWEKTNDKENEIIKLFNVYDIISAVENNDEVLNVFDTENVNLLSYYIENMNNKDNVSNVLSKIELNKKDPDITRRAFDKVMKDQKLIEVFIEYDLDGLKNIFIENLKNYTSYNFNYIKYEEGKELNILSMLADDRLIRNFSLMKNFYIVYKYLNKNKEFFDVQSWLSIFNEQENVYLNIFKHEFFEFIISLMSTCENEHNIDLNNIKTEEYELVKQEAQRIAKNDFTIKKEETVFAVEYELENDWVLFERNTFDFIYFEILNKLKFLGLSNNDVLSNEELSKDIKTMFILKQMIFSLNDSESYILDLNFKNKFDLNFSEEIIDRVLQDDCWETEGYRKYLYTDKKFVANVVVDIKEFFNFCYLIEEQSSYKRKNVVSFMINIMAKYVNFNQTKNDFIKENKEYDTPIFNEIISKYLK